MKKVLFLYASKVSTSISAECGRKRAHVQLRVAASPGFSGTFPMLARANRTPQFASKTGLSFNHLSTGMHIRAEMTSTR